jgi:gluconolactonase
MELELLASGYGLIEGPRVDPDGNLYFSDVPNGGVYRRSPVGEITVAVPKRRGVGGIAIHADGGLVLSGRNICHVRDGETRVLYEDPTALGYNDLFCDDEGRVFVGVLRSNPFDLGSEQPATGELVRVDAEGRGTVLYGEVGVSNGIGLSPDRRTLYHADTNARGLIVHDLAPDGSVSNRRLLAVPDLPDGLAVDSEGGVWVACYGGGRVQRYLPDGTADVAVEVPSTAVTSCCFGLDPHELFVVTADHSEDPDLGGCVFRTRVEVEGLPVPPARI